MSLTKRRLDFLLATEERVVNRRDVQMDYIYQQSVRLDNHVPNMPPWKMRKINTVTPLKAYCPFSLIAHLPRSFSAIL